MINSRLFKIFIIVAVVFFQARFLSHLFLKVGEFNEFKEKLRYFKVSQFLFPLNYVTAYEIAYALLERGVQEKDNTAIKESIGWFNRSLRNNPFYYLSHYHLGKAYLFCNYPQSDYFTQAVTAFKRTVQLNDQDSTIVLDTAKVLVTLWPLLEESDKELTRNLLLKTTRRLDWDGFADIVEKWWLYARDEAFMQKFIRNRPEFLYKTAGLFARLGTPLIQRWSLLAEFEDNVFQQVKNQTNSFAIRGNPGVDRLRGMLNNLDEIKFYRRLLGKVKFSQREYIEIRNKLLQNKITALLIKSGKKPSAEVMTEIRSDIFKYINSTDDFKQLDELKSILANNSLFDPNDFRALYLKYLLDFKLGNFSELIDEIEKLRSSIALTKSEYQDDYIDVLLMLADSLESSRLLPSAEQVVREIMEKAPRNPAVFWRMMRIQKILGADQFLLKEHFEMFRQVQESRLIDFDAPEIKKTVFLTGEKEIEVLLNDNFEKITTGKKLFQVFIDDRIVFEDYIEKLGKRITVPLAEENQEFKTIRIEIKVI